ncbi:MAG: LytR C-terminal domain-containing protein [Treponema sp.]|jgi:anionic cell wall polymer biosynthesis LytR-Cps2A-Psr (LCP) family protein|nr:LytR C-terminal domain-containing protein [Treponema sp.]
MRTISGSGKGDASVFLLIAIVLLLAGGIIVAVYTLRSDPVEEIIYSDRVITVLYVIEKDKKPLSTFVLLYYGKTQKAAIFDVPGELWVLIRRMNRYDHIDAVYEPGKISAYEGEVERLLGLDIAFSVVMDIGDLGKAVDLIEGVEVFIPSKVAIHDENNMVYFPSGLCRLDGDKSKVYISYTAPNEDREMVTFRRQRFFLGFLKRQAEMNKKLNNRAVLQTYLSFMQDSLNQRTKKRLLEEFARIDIDRINIQTVGGNLREVSGKIQLIPYYDGNLVKDIVRQVLGALTNPVDNLHSERVYTVEILNGTSQNGLAGRTAELYRGFGYDVISIGNAPHTGYENTIVIDRSGVEGMAGYFAGIIRCKIINQENSGGENMEGIPNVDYRSDFTLIIGRDFNGRYVTGN